jgi:hypothetical protein
VKISKGMSLNPLRKKMIIQQRINIVLGIILLTVVFLWGTNSLFSRVEIDSRTEVTSDMVEEKLKTMSELTVTKYSYKNVVSYKDVKRLGGYEIPLTQKAFIVLYTGYVKAGIDFGSLKVTIQDPTKVTVTLPSATITDNVINEESLEVYDEKSGFFNALTYENFNNALIEEKEKIRNEILASGFLEESNERAKLLVQELLFSMNFQEVQVIIQE